VSNLKPSARGRPASTSHAAVGRTALELFARRGFEQTTLDEIAAAAGVSRRTLFRYYPSKNDMVWGDFDYVLARLRRELDATGAHEPVMEALARAVIASNHYERDQLPELRIRLTLISTVPALQAHSMLRYASWRRVVAQFVADRLGFEADDLVPQTIGWAALGASMAAFVRWVNHPDESLESHLRQSYDLLVHGQDTLLR
jgi:mycofactocin system transcriptional regulator